MQQPLSAAAQELASTVLDFAEQSRKWPEALLEHEAWAWDDYDGPRFAHLHTVMTLRALAARIRMERSNQGPLLSLAQHALGDARIAYRDLQALLTPLDAAMLDRVPRRGEMTIREVLGHVYKAECYFALSIANALELPGGRDAEEDEIRATSHEGRALIRSGAPAEAWQVVAQRHAETLARFVSLTDIEVERMSAMWESKPYPILWRLYRLGAHVREHTIQVEKSLAWMGMAPEEGDLHARQIYAAMGEVEAALMGAGAVGREATAQTARELALRYDSLAPVGSAIERFVAAVEQDDVATARALVAEHPSLARTRMEGGETARLHALYRERSEMAALLREAPFRRSPQEAAAYGEVERLAEVLAWYPELLDGFSRDGFTLLHLAARYGQPETLRLLLEKGARTDLVSTDGAQPTALHAAVVGGSVASVELLLAAGAEVNERRADGATALTVAAEKGDRTIESMLRAAGGVE
jgi:hypothetical protein